MYYNQFAELGINYQQPFQGVYNSTINQNNNYEMEKYFRQKIRQDLLLEYDSIVNEARMLLNEVNKNQGNIITRDSQNIYLTLNNENITKSLNDLGDIESKLSIVLSREVKIVQDTTDIVKIKNNNPHKIYLPLFLIPTRTTPIFVYDIYDNIGDKGTAFNLFIYTAYLTHRLNDSIQINKQELRNTSEFLFKTVSLNENTYYISLTEKYFIKLFIYAMTLKYNAEYIEEWLTYFFKTLRRVKNNLVFIGNKDVSKEMFYDGIIQQIFGYYNCITITDYMLESLTIDTIISNKLFIHIDHIPENEVTQKKLKNLIESLIVYDGIGTTKYMCQIIFTLEQPHPFLNDFLSHSKVYFVDSIDNINIKLNQPDRVSLLNNIAKNLDPFSKQLAALDLPSDKQYSNRNYYMDINYQEVQDQRGTLTYSPRSLSVSQSKRL